MSFMRLLLQVVLSLYSVSSVAADLDFDSGRTQTVMVELYTSEGCNSCPPSERFLNSFVEHPGLWQTYIPLAFHVDYWDYLGWRDVYATPAHTLRQQTYGKVLQARTIYTPEFFVNGQEWRRGFMRRPPAPTGKTVGALKVSLRGEAITAVFAPEIPYTQALELHVARLGMDLASNIRAGENAGRSTVHQFVVLGHAHTASVTSHWQTTLPPLIAVPAGKHALVLWVSEVGNPTPLQATGGYLAPGSAAP